MKLFKRQLDFSAFGIHVRLSFSTYRYGFKREEQKLEEIPNTIQQDLFNDKGRGQGTDNEVAVRKIGPAINAENAIKLYVPIPHS